jgi:hypothetical protein
VLQLRGLPAELYLGPLTHLCNPAPAPCSPPPLPPAEIKRQRIYSQLSALESAGVLMLARGLQNADVSVRSNSALALYYLSDDSQSSDRAIPRVDIRAALPALIVAAWRLKDRGTRGTSHRQYRRTWRCCCTLAGQAVGQRRGRSSQQCLHCSRGHRTGGEECVASA